MADKQCPKCGGMTEPGGKSCSCGWQEYRKSVQIDHQCSWNDYGHCCDRTGWMSQSTNGGGPWYCRQHFDNLLGSGAKGKLAKHEHAEWMQDITTLLNAKRIQV